MPNWKKLIVSGSDASLNSLTVNGTVTTSYINANGSGNSILVGDTLRIDENGSGLRMTNVGAFDNSSGDFRIFATQDLILATNGENGTAVTIDQTSKNANFVGAVTASTFVGDGSGLTNISAQVAEQATVVDSFTSVTSRTINHNFGTKNVLVSVYDGGDQQIIPSSVTTTDANNIDITFDVATTGRAVVAKGGHLVSGSVELFTHRETITGDSSYTINHNLNEDYPIVQVYDSGKSQVIPGSITSTNTNTINISFDNIFEGTVVVKK